MRPSNRPKATLLILALLLIAVSDFAITSSTRPLQVIHIIFAGLYLLPIVAGAVWFGLRGGIATSLGVAAVYLAHMTVAWPDRPAESANQYAMVGVHLVVGVVSGALVRREEQERMRRLEAERRMQREAIVQGIASLANALGQRDEYTRGHSERVAVLALAIGRRLGLSSERLERLRLASLMHDLGKIGVRDDVLLKADRLTAEERSRIERHPLLAAEILRPIQGTAEIAEIVLAHHECPDGSGYPRGLRRDQIPLEAGILRVADVFSALTDARVYKPGMDPSQAIDWMLKMSGTKLDAEAVETLQSVLREAEPEQSPDLTI